MHFCYKPASLRISFNTWRTQFQLTLPMTWVASLCLFHSLWPDLLDKKVEDSRHFPEAERRALKSDLLLETRGSKREMYCQIKEILKECRNPERKLLSELLTESVFSTGPAGSLWGLQHSIYSSLSTPWHLCINYAQVLSTTLDPKYDSHSDCSCFTVECVFLHLNT